MQGRHVSRGCWGFSGWVLWAWTVGFKGTLGLACEPRSAWCVRPMWLALGTLYVVRVVVVGLGFGLRTHVSILFLWSFVRFSGPLLLRRPAGSPGRPWVSVFGLPGALVWWSSRAGAVSCTSCRVRGPSKLGARFN